MKIQVQRETQNFYVALTVESRSLVGHSNMTNREDALRLVLDTIVDSLVTESELDLRKEKR